VRAANGRRTLEGEVHRPLTPIGGYHHPATSYRIFSKLRHQEESSKRKAQSLKCVESILNHFYRRRADIDVDRHDVEAARTARQMMPVLLGETRHPQLLSGVTASAASLTSGWPAS
jgi:hypothetical protein